MHIHAYWHQRALLHHRALKPATNIETAAASSLVSGPALAIDAMAVAILASSAEGTGVLADM